MPIFVESGQYDPENDLDFKDGALAFLTNVASEVLGSGQSKVVQLTFSGIMAATGDIVGRSIDVVIERRSDGLVHVTSSDPNVTFEQSAFDDSDTAEFIANAIVPTLISTALVATFVPATATILVASLATIAIGTAVSVVYSVLEDTVLSDLFDAMAGTAPQTFALYPSGSTMDESEPVSLLIFEKGVSPSNVPAAALELLQRTEESSKIRVPEDATIVLTTKGLFDPERIDGAYSIVEEKTLQLAADAFFGGSLEDFSQYLMNMRFLRTMPPDDGGRTFALVSDYDVDGSLTPTVKFSLNGYWVPGVAAENIVQAGTTLKSDETNLVVGGAEAETLNSFNVAAANVLVGMGGGDTFVLGGRDVLKGLSGDSVYGDSGRVRDPKLSGTDIADYSGSRFAIRAVIAVGGTGGSVEAIDEAGEAYGSRDRLNDIEGIIGTRYADQFVLTDGLTYLDGGGGHDRVDLSRIGTFEVIIGDGEISVRKMLADDAFGDTIELRNIEEIIMPAGGGVITVGPDAQLTDNLRIEGDPDRLFLQVSSYNVVYDEANADIWLGPFLDWEKIDVSGINEVYATDYTLTVMPEPQNDLSGVLYSKRSNGSPTESGEVYSFRHEASGADFRFILDNRTESYRGIDKSVVIEGEISVGERFFGGRIATLRSSTDYKDYYSSSELQSAKLPMVTVFGTDYGDTVDFEPKYGNLLPGFMTGGGIYFVSGTGDDFVRNFGAFGYSGGRDFVDGEFLFRLSFAQPLEQVGLVSATASTVIFKIDTNNDGVFDGRLNIFNLSKDASSATDVQTAMDLIGNNGWPIVSGVEMRIQPQDIDAFSKADPLDPNYVEDFELLYGGLGNDTLRYAIGPAEFIGGAGDDVLDASQAASSVLYGGTGNDTLYASEGSSLIGGGGDDTYVISQFISGRVQLATGLSIDDVHGENRIVFEGYNIADMEWKTYDGVHLFDGPSGVLLLHIPDPLQFWTIVADDGEIDILDFMATVQERPPSEITFNGSTARDVDYSSAVYSAIYNLPGNGDRFVGSALIDGINGNGGNDTLFGEAGDDTLNGGDGNDLLFGGSGNNALNGGAGAWDGASYFYAAGPVIADLSLGETASNGFGGQDTLTGIEILYGGPSGDRLTGDSGRNELWGNGGDDTLRARAGNDIIFASEGDDIIDGGSGDDGFSMYYAPGSVDVDLEQGLVVADGFGTHGRVLNVENLYGSGFDDRLVGSALSNMIYGNAGNDSLSGGGGDDFLDGGQGYDTASYEQAAGRVVVNLNVAADIGSGQGVDTFVDIENVIGSDHSDRITGTSGNNNLSGGAGDDELFGLAGDDVLFGGLGDDSLNGAGGADELNGQEGADTVKGGAGSDLLVGGQGNDVLVGGASIDVTGSVGAQVYRLYRAVLDRDPDTGGFDNWSARLESGERTLAEVVSGFTGSPEFGATYGALGNEAFVTLLYNNVLNRAPDTTGLANWTAQLDGGIARETVVQGFSQSPEFIQATATEAQAYVNGDAGRFADDVYRLYQATLDREPDLTGLQNWSARLAQGSDMQTLIGGFTGSPEFGAAYGTLGNEAFVTLLYNNVLDRTPDPTGLANWTARLEGGITRETVVQGFSQSPEFIRATAAPFRAFMEQIAGDTLDGGPGDDLLQGSMGVDTFVFGPEDAGRDRVLWLDPWDMLDLTGFGYSDPDSARAQLSAAGPDVRFADQGVEITFMRSDLGLFDDVTILV